MYTETMKLHVIEEVLKTNNQAVLAQVGKKLNDSGKAQKTKSFSAHEFIGKWNKADAELIEKAIEDGCEQINADDWK